MLCNDHGVARSFTPTVCYHVNAERVGFRLRVKGHIRYGRLQRNIAACKASRLRGDVHVANSS